MHTSEVEAYDMGSRWTFGQFEPHHAAHAMDNEQPMGVTAASYIRAIDCGNVVTPNGTVRSDYHERIHMYVSSDFPQNVRDNFTTSRMVKHEGARKM